MKTMKKLASLLLALVMVLGLATSAFAEGTTYSITITNTNNTISISGKTYSAYKLFDSTHNGSAYAYTMKKTNQFYSADLIAESYSGTDTLAALLRTYFTFTPAAGDDTTVNVVPKESLTNATTKDAAARELADGIQKFLSGKTATATATVPAGKQSVTIDLSFAGEGYYIVTGSAAAAGGSANSQDVISAVILTSANPTASVNPKAGVPTLDKKITGVTEDGSTLDAAGKAAVAKVGATVSYELDSVVPDLTGYTDYTFTFGDTITAGLDYVRDSFVLKIAGTTVTGISPVFTENGKSFTLTIPYDKLKTYAKDTAIVLTYNATVNATALTYNYEKNTASLTYSNNPYDTNSKDKTPDKETYVVNINLDVDKVAGSADGAKLANAEFKLYKEVTDDETETTTKQYYKWNGSKVTWVIEEANADTFVTDANGKLTTQIRGLDQGTYYLVETKAPAGYNLLTAPIAITISASVNTERKIVYTAEGATVTNGTIDITEEQAATKAVATTTVINKTGTELPSTGGIGTTLFYAVGGILVVLAAVLLVTKRRADSRN